VANFIQLKKNVTKLKDFIGRRTTPTDLTINDGIRYWQERLLLVFVFIGTFLGFFVYLPSVVLSIKEDLWSIAAADTVIYSWVIILFFSRSVPFVVRALTFSVMGYILGMILLLTIGPFGGGPVWLFAFPIIVAILLGLRFALISLALNAGTIIIIGLLLQLGHIDWDYSTINPIEKWVVIGLNFMLLNSITTISIALISEGIQNLLMRQKSMLASLKKSEEKLKESQRIAHVGSWSLDILNNQVVWSDELYKMHGFDPSLPPPPFTEHQKLFTPESWDRLSAALTNTQNTGILYELELETVREDGSSGWMWVRGEAEKDSEGKIIGLWGAAQNITERKRNEGKLKLQSEIITRMSEGVSFVGKDGIIIYTNPEFEKMFGYDSGEMIGLHASILNAPTEKHPYEIAEEILKILYNKGVWSGEIQNLKKDRTSFWSAAKVTAIEHLEYGKSFVSVHTDISELKQAKSEKKKFEAKLQQAQKMESIGTLAGGIAHDFNNILSSVLGYTELALGGVEKGTELEDDLQEVRKAGMRAKDLVKQILTFARQSDEADMPIQINIIAKEVLKFIKSSIPSTIQINNKIYSDSLIMGSSTQIHQVLMNLCTNAAQAMEEKGGMLEVSVNDTTIDKMFMIPNLIPGEYIEIKVSDTGMGIAPQNLHTIFEPYFTTKPVGEGTGMGLAVVHGIIEKYGGKISVNSTIGKGTCFTIYLPITKKRKVHMHAEKEELPHGNENILFVDDEAPIAKMGSKVLEQLGYSVTTRTSSVEALELFKSMPQEFDLVVTDMTMPNMTGDKMAVEMMKIRSDIPVVLCTGYNKQISEESAAELGIKALAHKPIVKADLAKTVRKVLDEANSLE